MSTEKGNPRRYFSSRKRSRSPISLHQAHSQLEILYALYRDKGYFQQKLGTGQRYGTSEEHKRLALITLGFNAFPVKGWSYEDTTEGHVFDVSFSSIMCLSRESGLILAMIHTMKLRGEKNLDRQPIQCLPILGTDSN